MSVLLIALIAVYSGIGICVTGSNLLFCIMGEARGRQWAWAFVAGIIWLPHGIVCMVRNW